MIIAIPSNRQFHAWHVPSILRVFPNAELPKDEPEFPFEIEGERIVPLRMVLPELSTGEEYGDATVVDRGDYAEYVYEVVEAAVPQPDPVFVYKLDLFERTTNAEAEAILAAMDAQPARIRMIFNAAQSFREDHELWPLLTGAATETFGVERASQLLAPSE